MSIVNLKNPTVRDALTAINARDRDGWFALFSTNAALTDDGEERELVTWSDNELFTGATFNITAILREEDDGTSVYTRCVSSKWGEMDSFWRFAIHDGEITRLDVGQA